MNIYRYLTSFQKWVALDTELSTHHAIKKARALSATTDKNALVTVAIDSPDRCQPLFYFYNGQYVEANEAFYAEV